MQQKVQVRFQPELFYYKDLYKLINLLMSPIHTISSVARYMSKASEEKVRNLKVMVEMLGFHLVGRPTAAYPSPSSWTIPSPSDLWGL